MCGIAGYAGWTRSAERSSADLRAMCDAIRHRGPDEDGYYIAPGVALGMRRLSIIDVAGGRQPIGNEDGSVQVVFNGEIYNHRQLRDALRGGGHRFQTRADTETLVHLYEDRGDALVSELRGMFTYAIWDARRSRLSIARDRVGIKPLYYWETPDGVAFASELRSFLALPEFTRRVDPVAVGRYLAFGYVPDPHCIFEGVRKLAPGHRLSWSRDEGVRVTRYWTPGAASLPSLTEEDAVEELRRLLHECVGSHLESEVPLGAFLSGGIDSSSVVAEMARQMDRPVRTFSIGFEEAGFNEAPDAAAVARALRTEHTELIVRPDADQLLESVVHAFDEPFADSSALPTLLVSQLARGAVTVALSGDGGDELFGGYTRYTELLARREMRPAALRPIMRDFARRLPQGALGRNRLLDIARVRWGRYAATVAHPVARTEGGVATDAIAAAIGSLDAMLDPWTGALPSRDFLSQMSLVDVMTYLPGDILTKVDRMSMAVSLEARVPLLDHHLVEFALALPGSLKVRAGTGKWILRRAVEPLVPPRVLAKRKQGFGVPLGRWFRRELRHRVDALLVPSNRALEFVDHDAVVRVAAEHHAGRRDHSALLWRLVVLHHWLDALATGTLGRRTTIAPMTERDVVTSRPRSAASVTGLIDGVGRSQQPAASASRAAAPASG